MIPGLITLGVICLASVVIFMCAARVGSQADQHMAAAEDNPTWLLQQLEDQFTPAEQGYAAVFNAELAKKEKAA